MGKDEAKRMLKRLALHHNAELIDNELENGLCFRFRCGNEAMSWDNLDLLGMRSSASKPIVNENELLDMYIRQRMFLKVCSDGEWSEDFN